MLIKEQRQNDNEKKFAFFKGTFFFLFAIFCTLNSNAQCAMCRAALESEGNKTKVEAVNDGIIFLMAIPYIIVIAIGFAIYKMYYKKGQSAKP